MIASEIRITCIAVDCPGCSNVQRGFSDDPRSYSFTCDDCGCRYQVAEDAELTFANE